MKARVPAPRTAFRPEDPQPWSGVEPEELEDAARSLCALRPGSRAAERLMERASYLRTIRNTHAADPRRSSALLLA